MTEIKIPFTKIEVEKYSGSDKPANAEVLTLKIIPIAFGDFYEKLSLPLDSCLNKIKISFWDGAEKEIYNNLLDDSKEKFELSFEKEKVEFYMVGVEDRKTDDTKIEINYFSIGSNASLEINFQPQFAGVVKITSTSQNDNGKDRPNDNGGDNDNGGGDKNDDTKQKITNLQIQINELEKKLREKPNSSTKQQDNQKLARLKTEIEELKKKQKDKSQNENNRPKDNFPYGLVIGGGIVIFLLLIAVIFF